MTRIQLMNHGRGAGKTHTLKNWQQEKSKHRFIVCLSGDKDLYPEVPSARLTTQLGLVADTSYFVGYQDWEVAFDNFDITSRAAFDALRAALKYHPKTVILATNYETMSTDATRQLNERFKLQGGAQITDTKFFIDNGLSVEDVASYTFAKWPGRAVNVEAQAEADDGQLEPIQKVKAEDLRLGDWVVGKGRIRSLAEDDYRNTAIETIEEGNGQTESTSTIILGYDKVIDVDITKRK